MQQFRNECRDIFDELRFRPVDPYKACEVVDKLTRAAMKSGYGHRPQFLMSGSQAAIMMVDPEGQSTFALV